jgi:hypothetical protein
LGGFVADSAGSSSPRWHVVQLTVGFRSANSGIPASVVSLSSFVIAAMRRAIRFASFSSDARSVATWQ